MERLYVLTEFPILKLIGAAIIVVFFVKAFMGNGKGGSDGSNNSSGGTTGTTGGAT